MSWIYKLEQDPSYISKQSLNQPVDFKQIVSSNKTYKSKRRNAIANLMATSNFRIHHTNAKESYRTIDSTNQTIHHMWYTRHINNILEMHPPQYCPMSWTYKLQGHPSHISQQHLNQPLEKDIQHNIGGSHQATFSESISQRKGKYQWNQNTTC